MERDLQRSYWKLSVKWVSVEEGIHVIYKELCTNFKQTGFTFSKQAGKRSIWKVKKKLIKAEVRNCPAHLLPFPAPAALPGYWLLGWHPPDPNRWSLQGKGAKPLSSLPICLGGNGSLGWSWHSVQACLCNRGSHCLETHYNLSPAQPYSLRTLHLSASSSPSAPPPVSPLCAPGDRVKVLSTLGPHLVCISVLWPDLPFLAASECFL